MLRIYLPLSTDLKLWAQAPLAQASLAQAPIAQAPLAQAPLAQAPLAISQAPLAQAPLSQAPLAQAPLTPNSNMQWKRIVYSIEKHLFRCKLTKLMFFSEKENNLITF